MFSIKLKRDNLTSFFQKGGDKFNHISEFDSLDPETKFESAAKYLGFQIFDRQESIQKMCS